MSEQQQETPVWHAIVGEGWEPVQFGEMAGQNDEVLVAQGWVPNNGGGFIFQAESMPRRRRKASYEILSRKNGQSYNYLKAAKPGDRFMLTGNGKLVPIEVNQ